MAAANHLKNSGFYVDINNSKWLSPKNISNRQFNKSHDIVKTILDNTKQLQELIEEESEMLSDIFDVYNTNIRKHE